MKKFIKATESKVTLKVVFEPYDRFESTGIKTAKVTGDDLLDALCKMVDHMGLYIRSEDIRDEGWTSAEVIDSISSSNGDGCDYILSLDNLTTGERLIESDYTYEEEEW